ncbi:MAG: 7-cyano-7-deazaguanine/7-aminomethyl-7-deazaguanine transporter [Legionella sp.]|nr:7-cyano-7-deazaguanine/7-aminomethyl-7-deazaguanine transporter [Legionella sp.]
MNHNIQDLIIKILSVAHIFLLTISNILVQYPFEIFGYHTTWGAFTYPAIFILTDLTTRLTSAKRARKIIYQSMLPGLCISYVIACYIGDAGHVMPLRIALACFIAYVVGQLLDIFVFQRYRNQSAWWFAPVMSTIVGNSIDTLLFFSIAFYHCSHPVLSQHWPEIAVVDMMFKCLISLFAFIPAYGLILNAWNKKRSFA